MSVSVLYVTGNLSRAYLTSHPLTAVTPTNLNRKNFKIKMDGLLKLFLIFHHGTLSPSLGTAESSQLYDICVKWMSHICLKHYSNDWTSVQNEQI